MSRSLKDALKSPMKHLADDMTAVIRNWDLIKDRYVDCARGPLLLLKVLSE